MTSVPIPLTQGKFALIDVGDWLLVSGKRWHALTLNGRTYAYHALKGGGSLAMHRLIVDAPDGMDVDHLNGDGLDNRRGNLRVVTRSENLRNRSPYSKRPSSSGILNVYRQDDGQFYVQLFVNKKAKRIGTFRTLAEASIAAYKARLEHFGPQSVARLPKPEGLQL